MARTPLASDAAGLAWWRGSTGSLVEPAVVAAVSGRVVAVLAVVIVWWWRVGRDERIKRGYRTLPGLASRRDLAAVDGEKAVLKSAGSLRPSLRSPSSEDMTGVVGTRADRTVWASVRETHLLVGPPGSGKGLQVVINGILDAPGGVITASTRPDNLAVTYQEVEGAAGP